MFRLFVVYFLSVCSYAQTVDLEIYFKGDYTPKTVEYSLFLNDSLFDFVNNKKEIVVNSNTCKINVPVNKVGHFVFNSIKDYSDNINVFFTPNDKIKIYLYGNDSVRFLGDRKELNDHYYNKNYSLYFFSGNEKKLLCKSYNGCKNVFEKFNNKNFNYLNDLYEKKKINKELNDYLKTILDMKSLHNLDLTFRIQNGSKINLHDKNKLFMEIYEKLILRQDSIFIYDYTYFNNLKKCLTMLEQRKSLDFQDSPSWYVTSNSYLDYAPKHIKKKIAINLVSESFEQRGSLTTITQEIVNKLKNEFAGDEQLNYLLKKIGEPVLENIEDLSLSKNDSIYSFNRGIFNPISVNSISQLKSEFSVNSILIDVWATWCKPCIDDFKYYKKAQAYFKENNVLVLFVNIDRDPEALKQINDIINEYDLQGLHLFVKTDSTHINLQERLEITKNHTIWLPKRVIYDGRFVLNNDLTFESIALKQ